MLLRFIYPYFHWLRRVSVPWFSQKTYRDTGTGFMAWGCTQPGLTRWGWLIMPHQHNCSDTVAFNSWRLDFVALRICSDPAPNSCCSMSSPSKPSSVAVRSRRVALWAARENSSMRWKETLPPALRIWRSGFGFSLWRSCWPLFGIKFQYFMIRGILFSPSNLLGYPGEIAKSGDSASVWKVFTLLQRDSLMVWFKRS